MNGLSAGSLNREFTLQRPSGLDGDYATVDTVWGSIRFANGAEVMRLGTQQATGAYVVTMYYRDDLQASWRLYEAATGRALQITSFGDPDGRMVEMRVFCVEAQ